MHSDAIVRNDVVAPVITRPIGRIERALMGWLVNVLVPAMVKKYLAEMGIMQEVIQ
jgi:hypothetical protein